MVQLPKNLNVNVMWKGRKFVLELSSDASLKELGEELQALTDVKADTLKLIIPQSSTKTSKLFMPFSDDHSCIRLQDTGIAEGKPLRMMGVYEHEVDQLLKDAKANLRIAGFEEERRMKQRISRGPQASLKLPQGPYIFCDFRTLELPGVQLNPPPSEALKLMHMLASDPGIVAIMNKHRWRVGIMTEMAPVGYVGISPKCLLGFNKNRGEEISLRLRTDDLKGFRKYESIKKTLLHELAHMVYSEHDSNFYALDKQLNQEAFSLDWTRSRGYTLSDTQITGHDDMEIDFESESSLPQKLGGTGPYMAVSAREASVAAAYHRFADSSTISQVSENHGESESVSSEKEDLPVRNKLDGCYQEPDPDDSGARESMNSEPYAEANEGITQVKLDPSDTELGATVPKFPSYEGLESAKLREEPDPDDSDVSGSSVGNESRTVDTQTMQIETNAKIVFKTLDEPDPDDLEARRDTFDEPDPDDLGARKDQLQPFKVHTDRDPDDAQEVRMERAEPDPDDKSEPLSQIMGLTTDEPDPDDQELRRIQDPVNVFCNQLTKAIETLRSDESRTVDTQTMQIETNAKSVFKTFDEPDPDDLEARRETFDEPDPDDLGARKDQLQPSKVHTDRDPDDAQEVRMERAEPDPDDKSEPLSQIMGLTTDEPDLDDQELRRIQDPVNVFCNQLTKAMETLRSDVSPLESKAVLETLYKIIRNVSESPNEMKYKKLRKANPVFQRSIAYDKAAMEILSLIGFNEDIVTDETGKSETYLVLKRNDPGLVWLAKSALEKYIS